MKKIQYIKGDATGISWKYMFINTMQNERI